MSEKIQKEVEKERFKKRKIKNITLIFSMFIILIVISFISISVGASSVNVSDVLNIIFKKEVTDMQRQVVLLIRLPRVLAGILSGMALASAGLLMQGVFQNPLVSPYTLGISNGAAFGAALAIIFGSRFSFISLGQYLIPVSAFTFSIITMILVYYVAKLAKDNTKTLVLSGVAVGYLFSALVSSLKYISDVRELPELVFWTMGGLSGIPWVAIMIMLVTVTISLIIMMKYAWDLNVMAFGEETALSLGVNYKKTRNIALVICTLLTAVAVSFTGVIGFIGLISPHVIKMIIGTDHRYSIPASALFGGILLLTADTIARNIIAPTELPVGIITSFIGVPFFIYLICTKKR